MRTIRQLSSDQPLVSTIFITILTLSALYAPQPLLPVISREFSVSREAAAALTTVSFIPLALAPLAYGYLLEAIPATRLLKIAVPLLAVSEFCFAGARNFPLLLLIRLGQGLLIPALLTSLMTYLSSRASSDTVQHSMAVYIAATIAGGFLGRLTSGFIASWLGWRYSFLILAVSLLAGFFLVRKLPEAANLQLTRPQPKVLLDTLKKPPFRAIYLSVFCLFLVFAAAMNYLPFRLTELSNQANEWRIGLMYSGYTMGIVSSLGAPLICRKIGGERRVIRLGLLCFGITLAGLAAGRIWLLFAIMFLFCATMFLAHATASGLVNRLAGGANRGLTNGLYVAFYYAGGVVGSFAPGWIYRQYGWSGFLVSLALVCLLSYRCSRQIRDS